jgi:AAA domain (dynein-related subfamily)
MDNTVFTTAIEQLRSFSLELAAAEADHVKLIALLNSLSTESRLQLHSMYEKAEGPIKTIRKEVSQILIERNIELSEAEAIIQKAIDNKPQSFGKMYKSWFNMLYMFLIADIRPVMTTAITTVSEAIIKGLGAEEFLVAKKFDFSGERETGSTRCWIAFVNKSHPNQKTAKQFFLNIQNGEVECSLYDRPNDTMTDKEVFAANVPFGINDALAVFEKHLPVIKADNWVPIAHYWRIGTTDEHLQYWDEMREENKVCIGWPDIGDLNNTDITNKKSVIQLFAEAGYYPDDPRVRSRKAGEVFNFYDKIQPGDIVLAQKGSNVQGIGRVTGEYAYDGESDFPHQRMVDWLIFNPVFTNDIGLQTTVYEIDDKKIQTIVQNLINKGTTEPTGTATSTAKMILPLNQILFGPPGTGKTYATVKKALEIMELYDENKSRESLKEGYDNLVAKGYISFTTFHQSMSYEDFIEGIKPDTNEQDGVIYEVQPGIFKNIAELAKSNWLSATKNIKEQLSFEDAFIRLQGEWEDNPEMKFPLKREGNDYTILGFTKSSIQFKKASGGTGHTLSIATLRDYFYDRKERRLTGVGIYYPAILEKLKTYQPLVQADRKLKNFVLIIDEINRGNVSQIFGELITLIEDNKRLGKDEALTVTLPYSKESFGVPPNLYIIGTMNTADRSVEALDTALRRRFCFEEVRPDPSLIKTVGVSGGTVDTINLVELLTTINRRIEKLLDKDHQIGHSYLLQVKTMDDLKAVFQQSIIPLLQEYFYGDYGKIGLVLGKGFVKAKEWGKGQEGFADFDNESADSYEEREVYEIIDYSKMKGTHQIKPGTGSDEKVIDMNFEKALQLLMNKPIA